MLQPATLEPDTISLWLADGATLDEIERELLERGALSEEQCAALWLYAWSQVRPLGDPRRPLRRRPFAGAD